MQAKQWQNSVKIDHSFILVCLAITNEKTLWLLKYNKIIYKKYYPGRFTKKGL